LTAPNVPPPANRVPLRNRPPPAPGRANRRDLPAPDQPRRARAPLN